MTTIRLTLKHHRFEIAAAILIGIALAAAALVVTSHLNGVGATTACFRQWLTTGPQLAPSAGPVDTCSKVVGQFFEINESEAGKVMAAMAIAPFAIGILLGIPLLSVELQDRTAGLAWTLAGSRRRWLAARVAILVVIAIALLAALAVTSSILAAAREPWIAAGHSFDDLGLHGWMIVGRGLLALLVGLLIGLVVGRPLPAFILGVGACLALAVGLGMGQEAWIRAASVPFDESSQMPTGSILTGEQQWRAPDGSLVSWDVAVRSAPAGTGDKDLPAWVAAHFTSVQFGVSGSRYPELELAETVLLLGGAGGLFLVTLPVIDRRRAT